MKTLKEAILICKEPHRTTLLRLMEEKMLLAEAQELINAIATNNHYELNSWEEMFVQSLQSQIDLDTKLTAKQEAKLKDIYCLCYPNP